MICSLLQKIEALHGDPRCADRRGISFAFRAMLHWPAGNHEAKEMQEMAKTSNKLVNPNAREAMNRFKMEAANEVGVNLKQGYNGDLTSKQAGSVGGQMVRKMIQAYENGMQ